MRKWCVAGIALLLLALAVPPHGMAAEALEVTLVKLTSPVSAGSTVTITIKTATGAECKGSVRWRTWVMSLASKTTGDDGTATWSWRTDANTRGAYPIEMQCAQGDKKGSLNTQFVVN